MSDQDTRYLEVFATWLRSLAEDARALAAVLGSAEEPEEVRRPVAGALSYLFKSLDLIDDGIEGLGYIDDAFVLRVAVRQIPESALAREGAAEVLSKLAGQADFVEQFLQGEYPHLERFVAGLSQLTVRGRSVEALLSDADVREEFVGDVIAWANRYEAPNVGQDPKNAVKLRAFLKAKLSA
jgi:uncharacterized membrane protein YkvA (DUF1232 family)